MSSEKILDPSPKGWSQGSGALLYYRKNASNNTKKDIGYLYQCVHALEQAILGGVEQRMTAETMDQLADMQRQIDVLSDVIQKIVKAKASAPAPKRETKKKAPAKKAK